MNYQKIANKRYNIHLINDKRWHTMEISLYFTEEVNKEKITYRNLLMDVLTYATQKYDTREKFINQCHDNYANYPKAIVTRFGNYLSSKITLSWVNSVYIEKGNIEENIKLLKEVILNPLVDKQGFLSKYIQYFREELITERKTLDEEPRLYANYQVLKLFSDNPKDNYNLTGYCDMKTVYDINSSNLYQSYLEMLENSKIDIFVIGDLHDEDNLVKMIENEFVFPKRKKSLPNYQIIHQEKRDKPKISKEVRKISQSKLSIGFKTYGLTDWESKYVYFVFNLLFGGGGDTLLQRSVREEHSLAYYIMSYFNRLDNILIVNCGINKESYEKTLLLIKDVLEKMSKGIFSQKDLAMCKTEYIINLEESLDTTRGLVDYYYGKEVFQSDDWQERKKNIQKVTKEDVMLFAKKLVMDVVFFLEGDL